MGQHLSWLTLMVMTILEVQLEVSPLMRMRTLTIRESEISMSEQV
jgi:hypothetical protein